MKIVLPFICNTLMNFAIGLLLARFLGPAEYGRMALALAAGVMIQTLVFDWLRLAGTRFYSDRVRRERPELRSTLDACLAALITALCLLTVMVLLAGIDVPLSNGLVALAVCAAVSNGLFDYHTALVRARFQDGAYARIIIGKNVLSLLLTVGGAFFFGSATMALAGLCISVTGSLVRSRRSIGDPWSDPRRADGRIVRQALAYAAPIVLANLGYQLIPLADRAILAHRFGFAESGHFSLAFDLGIRIVQAVGSTLDVLLFQIAVRAEEAHGADEARQQIARNMAIVLAIIAPTCLGFWLVLPSFEILIVPADFRGPFAQFLTLMLPGFFSFGLISYALHPVFQIRTRTAPIGLVAALAAVIHVGLIAALPAGSPAAAYPAALSVGYATAMLGLLALAVAAGAAWPSARDVGLTVLAAVAMGVAILPFTRLQPGALTLALEVSVGAAVYISCVLGADVAGLRGVVLGALPARLRIRLERNA